MSKRFPYVSGDHLAICDRCGEKSYASDLRHDGHFQALLVCEDCWDMRHPQLEIRIRPEPGIVGETRPEPADTFHAGADGTAYPKGF